MNPWLTHWLERYAPAWLKRSIRSKLLVLATLFLLFTVGLVFLLVYHQQHTVLQHQWAATLTTHARLIATQAPNSLLTHDHREASRLLSTLGSSPNIVAAQILSADGVPIAHYQREHESTTPFPSTIAQSLQTSDYLFVRYPIGNSADLPLLGYVDLASSQQQLQNSIHNSLVETAALLLVAFATALAITQSVIQQITAPVEQLSTLVNQAAENPLTPVRVNIQSSDELGNLGHGLNLMLNQLQAREQELTEYHAGLETLVESRTHALNQATAEARAANQAKSAFLARMSHEIRTPMNAVIGLTRLVLNSPLTPAARHQLEQVLNSSDALLHIINDILDYSKIEAGRMTLESRPFHLSDVFTSLQGLLGLKAHDKGLRLSFHAAPGIPALLQGDTIRLGQILINLVGNAIKFTEHGEVSVHVAPLEHTSTPEGLTLCFRVCDTGIGIAPEYLPELFSPFSQADDSITRCYGGTGLGLAICQQLVELMGGEISVTSTPGAGSCFQFTARFTPASPALKPSPAMQAALPAVPASPRRLWSGETILVVDDVEINRNIVVSLLEGFGLQADLACDGQQAVDKLLAHPYPLVLMDIQMPVLDGLSATRLIRSHASLADVPILAMTAHAMPEDRQRSHDAGMNAHLTKPIDPDVLYTLLAEWLPPSSTSTTTSAPVNTPQASESPELPTMRGIDTQRGLQLHDQRHTLYLKNLHAFRRDFAETLTRLRSQLAQQDDTGARRQVHSLKSVAASLGMSELADTARQLEQQLHTQPGSTVDLTVLETHMSEVLTSLSLLPKLQVNDPVCPVDTLLTRLTIQLQSADALAWQTVAQLQDALQHSSALHPLLSHLQDAVDDVEYREAQQLLTQLQQRWQGEPHA